MTSVRKRKCSSSVRFCSMPTFWPPLQRMITFMKFSTPSPWTYQHFRINPWTNDPCSRHERRHLRYHFTRRIFKTRVLIDRTVSTTATKEKELEPYRRVGQAEKPRMILVWCVYPSSPLYLLHCATSTIRDSWWTADVVADLPRKNIVGLGPSDGVVAHDSTCCSGELIRVIKSDSSHAWLFHTESHIHSAGNRYIRTR